MQVYGTGRAAFRIKDSQVGSVRREETPDGGVAPDSGGAEQGGKRLNHTAQKGMQFKTYGVFISRIFYLVFLDPGWQWVTETTKIYFKILSENICLCGLFTHFCRVHNFPNPQISAY